MATSRTLAHSPLLLFVAAALAVSARGTAEEGASRSSPWCGVVELHPGGTLWSPSLRGLRLDGGKYDVDVVFSSLPTLKAGLELETRRIVYRGTLGAGLLFNTEFLSPFGRAEISALFKIDETMTIGPQVGALYFSEPTWLHNVKARFSDAFGANVALSFTYGIPEASLSVSAGYIWASFDLESDRTLANRGSLDLSGPYVQLGVVLRF